METLNSQENIQNEVILLDCKNCSCMEPMQPCEACPNNAWLRLKEYKHKYKYKNLVKML